MIDINKWAIRHHVSDEALLELKQAIGILDQVPAPNITTEAWRLQDENEKLEARVKDLEQAQPKWISVDDELPTIGNYCLVYMSRRGFSPINITITQFTKHGFEISCVTHWMRPPQKPEVK